MDKNKNHKKLYKLIGKRNEKGLTMNDVAKAIGITKNTYYKKENGKSEFYLDEIRKILKLLDCSFDDIFFDQDVNQ